jgi:hypothetical protein
MQVTIEIPDFFEGSAEDGVRGTSLQDMVVNAAIDKLVTKARQDEWGNSLRERVQAIRDEEIRAAVKPAIEEALLKSVQPTDTYGMPKGEPMTLHEVIVKRATDWLTTPTGDRFDRKRVSPVQKVIQEEVERAFKFDLSKAMDEAKAQVREAVKQEGAALISETIARMAKVS